ncbi:MAG: NAD(P)H-hydrate dehydratase [Thermodesulfobacteriota bacterium]
MRLPTSQQMRALDEAAINEIGIPGMVLMENAGSGTVRRMCERFGDPCGRRIGILAGPGNNGGDGLVIARHLHQQGGRPLVFLTVDPDRLQGDAARNLAIVNNLGLPVLDASSPAAVDQARQDIIACDLLVDALFGTGLKRPVDGHWQQLIVFVNSLASPRIAVDIASGIDADTGQVLGVAIQADCTCTFGCAKPGHYLEPGRSHTGSLAVIDIGIPPEVIEKSSIRQRLLTADTVRDWLPQRAASAHKGTCGHLLLLAGSRGKAGAALLAGRGALRSGLGLLTIAMPQDLHQLVPAALAEAMSEPLAHSTGFASAADLASLRVALAGKRAIALGPGLGTAASTAELVTELYRSVPLPMTVDADGLNVLAPQFVSGMAGGGPRILTPHPGEMARISGLTTREIQADRIETARKFAVEHGVVLLLKGAATVIAGPNGEAAVNPTGNAGMATGGMGDVLTGIIGGLLAQGMDPFVAACAGAFLHGLAADILAEKTPWGYTAAEVADALPLALGRLLANPPPFINKEQVCDTPRTS